MLAFVNLDERVPPDHPLRVIKRVADDALDRMSADFDRMYSKDRSGLGSSRASSEGAIADLAVLDT